MRRDLRQASFADGPVNQRAGRNGWLDEIGKLINWSAVMTLLDPIYASDEGRPSYPLLTYVKLLLLQQWYGLSDPGLEEAVDDRLSFRRFAGLPLDESVPDHSTIWRFRQELAAWLRPNGSRREDGIPGHALGFGSVASRFAPLLMSASTT